MDTDPHTLDPSVIARINGEQRLRTLSLRRTYSGGLLALEVCTSGSSVTTITHGIDPDLLADLCAAFNDGLRFGAAPPSAPLMPEPLNHTDRRRAAALASGAPQAGDDVREREDTAALSRV